MTKTHAEILTNVSKDEHSIALAMGAVPTVTWDGYHGNMAEVVWTFADGSKFSKPMHMGGELGVSSLGDAQQPGTLEELHRKWCHLKVTAGQFKAAGQPHDLVRLAIKAGGLQEESSEHYYRVRMGDGSVVSIFRSGDPEWIHNEAEYAAS